MQIDISKSELNVLLLMVYETISKCRDSQFGLNYPGKNIDIFEALAGKLEKALKDKEMITIKTIVEISEKHSREDLGDLENATLDDVKNYCLKNKAIREAEIKSVVGSHCNVSETGIEVIATPEEEIIIKTTMEISETHNRNELGEYEIATPEEIRAFCLSNNEDREAELQTVVGDKSTVRVKDVVVTE